MTKIANYEINTLEYSRMKAITKSYKSNAADRDKAANVLIEIAVFNCSGDAACAEKLLRARVLGEVADNSADFLLKQKLFIVMELCVRCTEDTDIDMQEVQADYKTLAAEFNDVSVSADVFRTKMTALYVKRQVAMMKKYMDDRSEQLTFAQKAALNIPLIGNKLFAGGSDAMPISRSDIEKFKASVDSAIIFNRIDSTYISLVKQGSDAKMEVVSNDSPVDIGHGQYSVRFLVHDHTDDDGAYTAEPKIIYVEDTIKYDPKRQVWTRIPNGRKFRDYKGFIEKNVGEPLGKGIKKGLSE